MGNRKDDFIRIRTSTATKTMLNRAARLRGQTLSDFVLDSARRQAEETILDQCGFFLDARAHERFLAMLNAAAQPDMAMRARMNRKPFWEC
jgi:uncharacterized protein (DUF1778 family)